MDNKGFEPDYKADEIAQKRVRKPTLEIEVRVTN